MTAMQNGSTRIPRSRQTFREKYIGDKKFYKMVLSIAVPIAVQSGITNFVSLLDNIMVGRVGTEQMSGVAIVNTLYFVFMLALFGGLGGVGIYTAQYYGKNDQEGIRNTFRYKLWMGLIITGIAFLIFFFFGKELIGLYLNGSEDGGDLTATLGYAQDYLKIIFFSMPAVWILQTYSTTIKECGETVLPMKAGIAAVIINVVFNYLLIFGSFGFPKLGVQGAAIATVLSRYVEVSIVVIWTHTHKKRLKFVEGLYRTIFVPFKLVKKFFKDGILLLINETAWSIAMAMLVQCYSVRGLAVVAGNNISSTATNMFNVLFFSMGDAVAIIVGQKLGSGELQEAKDTDNKLLAFGVAIGFVTGILVAVAAFILPNVYNTSPEVKDVARSMLLINAAVDMFLAFTHCAYFTLRAGGKTWVTLVFDSVYAWVFCVPVAFILAHYTDLSIVWICIVVHLFEVAKAFIGYGMVKKNVWLQNIVDE